jgi:drug/metabolite transporter (DMT)-like permease
MQFNDQKKGTLMAFAAVMFLTPDSVLIRLADISSWNLIFYRGFIPFSAVFIGLLFFYKTNLIKQTISNSWHGIAYALIFAATNIAFVTSIENTNVANTLIMIALAPMLSAVLSFIFLKEIPDKKTWVAISITTLSVIYIFYDAMDTGEMLGNAMGLITACGLAVGAVIIRSAKKIDLVPSAMFGKLLVALIAFYYADDLLLRNFGNNFFNLKNDMLLIPIMCIMCVAVPFVLVTIAPRYITAAEVNLFFLLETILGPLWVWMVIKEEPSIETIIGGFVIIFTIAVHSFLSLKKSTI